MPLLKVPRLSRNRHGVWCYRLRSGDRDQRMSLGTKDPLAAHMMAAKINEAVATAWTLGGGLRMNSKNPTLEDLDIDLGAIRRYEVDIKNGTVKAKGAKDHKRAMEALVALGTIPGGWPPPARETNGPAPGKTDSPPVPAPQYAAATEAGASVPLADAEPAAKATSSEKLSKVIEGWLAERAHKNGARTVYAKQRHAKDFLARLKGDPAIDLVTKKTIVGFKAACLADGFKAKTVDNKLMTLQDLFKYAMAHGLYNASPINPVAGLFIQTKAERRAKAEPFKAFTSDDLKAMFEPEVYKKVMWAPDCYWGPLLGLYTGMRISEATGIYCDDVQTSENGVAIIHVRKSKSGAGIRNIPIAKALLDLGFLEFVEKQRKAGHERLFPHRPLINESYSKALGLKFRDHLMERGVRTKTDRSERKSFHSFRVNVITQLANNGANTPQSMRIVGHTSGSPGLEAHLGYVRDLPDLKALIDKLDWPIDIQGLRLPLGAPAK